MRSLRFLRALCTTHTFYLSTIHPLIISCDSCDWRNLQQNFRVAAASLSPTLAWQRERQPFGICHPLTVALKQLWDHFKAQFPLLHNGSSCPPFHKCPQTSGALGSMPGLGTGHLMSLGETLPLLLQSRNSGEGSHSQTLPLTPVPGRPGQSGTSLGVY